MYAGPTHVHSWHLQRRVSARRPCPSWTPSLTTHSIVWQMRQSVWHGTYLFEVHVLGAVYWAIIPIIPNGLQIQQEEHTDIPWDPDRCALVAPRRTRQARRVWGYQVCNEIHQQLRLNFAPSCFLAMWYLHVVVALQHEANDLNISCDFKLL